LAHEEEAPRREVPKVMFEVYREGSYDRRYRVVYFTDLDDHNRDKEIDRALSGERFLDGYFKDAARKEAKAVIAAVLHRLNDGEQVTPDELERELAPYLA
jgi:hypothetical protein